MSIRIADREIGPGRPALVIAEIGVNHDGSARRALQLVEHAAACGADAVKLQLFQARRLMHSSAEFAGYQRQGCADADAAAMLQRYELSREHVRAVVSATRDRGLIPLATPFSPEDVDLIAELDLPAIKIASPDLVNWPLLRKSAQLGKPLLVSTGAAEMEEVERAVTWLRGWRARFVLMHCVSSYPTESDDAHLCWIRELAERFGVCAGFSDHTLETHAGALAVAAGAAVIEKHLTYDRAASGPDHAASAGPVEFAEYVRLVRLAERLMGVPGKRVLPAERDVRAVSRQSLVLTRDLQAGHRLAEADLAPQRPGTGVAAARLPEMIGRRLAHSAAGGTLLQLEMLGDG